MRSGIDIFKYRIAEFVSPGRIKSDFCDARICQAEIIIRLFISVAYDVKNDVCEECGVSRESDLFAVIISLRNIIEHPFCSLEITLFFFAGS